MQSIDADIKQEIQDFLKYRREMTAPQHNAEILRYAQQGRDALAVRYPSQAAIRIAAECLRHIVSHSMTVKEKIGD